MCDSCGCGSERGGDKPVQYKCDCGCDTGAFIEFDEVPSAVPYCCGVPMKRTK